MADREIIGNEIFRAWITDSPRDYFPGTDLRARRFHLYRYDWLVLEQDVLLTDDTKYVLFFEVKEPFRNGEWRNVLAELPENMLTEFNKQYVVWLNITPDVVQQIPELIETAKAVMKNKSLEYDKIFIQGLVNQIVQISNDEGSP